MALTGLTGPWPLLQFRRTPWTSDSPSQGRYLYKGQHKHRINTYTNIHALSGIRIHDPSVRAGEDGSCLTPRSHCDEQSVLGQWNYRCNVSLVLISIVDLCW
jgi:hypothetical protein